jgi:uncharacterized protein (UPF0264 family)
MLDTANKAAGRLTTVLPANELSKFVLLARKSGLMSGLAGSLRLEDIAPLASLGSDVLGFRGALCERAVRASSIRRASPLSGLKSTVYKRSKRHGRSP